VKTIFSTVFVVSLFSALAGTFMSSAPDVLKDENRMRAEFPQFDIKKSFKRYFAQVDRFAMDNFPFRQYLIEGYRGITGATGVDDRLYEDKVIRGHDGWFFLGNAFDQTIEKLVGWRDPYGEKPYMAFGVERLALWFQEQGVNVVFLLGPNKSSVYPEKLPPIIKPSARRYVDRSLDWLRSRGVSVVDPTAALMERKLSDIVYWKRDTHWNGFYGDSWLPFLEICIGR